MQLLPPRQLARHRLLRIPQLTAHIPQLLPAPLHLLVRFRVHPFSGVVEKTEGPAIGAAQGGGVAVEGFLNAG